MPLVANSPLPTFARLDTEGVTVVPLEAAERQDIRELHIGLLNMMPDSALEATERQFFRLIGEANQIAQFYLHPFTLPQIERGEEAAAHVARHYERFEDLREQGLDALIITGANVAGADLSAQNFWEPLIEVVSWAMEQVTSTLCSCLATHAVMQFRYGHQRRPLGFKRWGVFPHRVRLRRHPLVAGVNTRFDVPHSRFNEVPAAAFAASGLPVLADSDGEVHLATSEDGLRLVFHQGHPEYDAVSLLKEYKREVGRWYDGERDDYPPFPDNYLGARARAILTEYAERLRAGRAGLADFPEDLVVPGLDNTWHDTAEAIMNNWIGKVYQVTSLDRRLPFRPNVDPDDPLRLRDYREGGRAAGNGITAG
jgi:homoserine O-succinyltransferase